MKTPGELQEAVRNYQGGNRESFDRLYELSYKYLHTCVIHVVKDEDAAMDMLQETYMEVSRSIQQLKSEEDFLSWAAMIANRKCFAYLKKDKELLVYEDGVTADEEGGIFDSLADDDAIIPEEILQDREKQRLIREIIENLSDMQRLCVIGYYYKEQKQEEIANELGIPLNTVKTNLSRAKARIKEAIIDMDVKKGTRLYSFAPFMLLFFSQETEACELKPMQFALDENTVSKVGQNAGKIKGRLSQMTMQTKVIIGAIAVGGIAAAVMIPKFTGNQNHQNNIVVQQTQGQDVQVQQDSASENTEPADMTQQTESAADDTADIMATTVSLSDSEHIHVWEEATCTTPKTCSECGETEGELSGHTWEEATCTSPKTCTVCGETEGDTVPHDFMEANYQSPAVCKMCGTTDGEAILGDFARHGIACNVELNKEYPYHTLTYRDKNVATEGTVVFSNYRTLDSDGEHEGLEGYEWRCVDLTFTYDDDNAWDYGTTSSPFKTDYYTCEPRQGGGGGDESDVGVVGEQDTYTVNYNGTDYTECLREDHALVMEWNDRVYTCKIQFSFRVPVGYDGSIVGAISDGQYNVGDYIYNVADENTLFFRLK